MSLSLEQLIESLDTHTLTTFDGPAFRMHNPAWAWSPLSGEGAKRMGGRFNPKGYHAFYLGLTISACYHEIAAGMPVKLLDPQITCSYRIKINGILDLRPYAELFAAPWRLQRLQGVEPPGWQLCAAIHQLRETKGIEIKGLWVPSYQAENIENLVLFYWDKGEVDFYDPDDKMRLIYGDKVSF